MVKLSMIRDQKRTGTIAYISTVSQRNIGEVYAELGTIRLQVDCSSKGADVAFNHAPTA